MNASEALRLTQKKNNAIQNMSEIIVKNIITKISFSAIMGLTKLIFEVPQYIESYPIVDYGKLIKEVCKRMRKRGYTCARVSTKQIFISWAENNKKK